MARISRTGTITRPSPFEDSGNRKGASETRARKAAEIADLRHFQSTKSYSPTRKRLNLRRYWSRYRNATENRGWMVGVTGIEPVTPTMST